MKIKKNTLLLIAMLITTLLLSGCGETGTIGIDGTTGKDDIVTTEIPDINTTEMKQTNTITNGTTDELLDNFEYLFTDIKNDSAAIKEQNFDDIVTIAVCEYDGDMYCLWLYDAKRSTVFRTFDVSKKHLPGEYKEACDISATDAQALIDTLKNDNSHNWDDTYPGRNIGTGSYSWSVIIEYKGGVIEKHIGYGNDCKLPRGFIELKNKLYGYKYE